MPKVTLTQQIQEVGVLWTRTKDVDLSVVPRLGDFVGGMQVIRVDHQWDGSILLVLDEEWDGRLAGSDSQKAAEESMRRDKQNGWRVERD